MSALTSSESPRVNKPLSPLNERPTPESPKVDKALSPQAEQITSEFPKPPSPKSAEKPPGGGGVCLPWLTLPQLRILRQLLPDKRQTSLPKRLPQAPSPMDLGLWVGVNQVKAHSHLSLEKSRTFTLRSQNPCGMIYSLSKPVSILVITSPLSWTPKMNVQMPRRFVLIWSLPLTELM
jgi:hypothetical protein